MIHKRGIIFVGDLVMACGKLGLSSPEDIENAAKLLGLELKGFRKDNVENVTQDFFGMNEMSDLFIQQESENDKKKAEEDWYLPGQSDMEEKLIDFELKRDTVTSPLRPKIESTWDETAKEEQDFPTPHLPILNPVKTRAFLSEVLSTQVENGAIEIDRLIEMIANCREIKVIPREPVQTLSRGCQVLIDVSEGMEPFTYDIYHILDEIKKVAGDKRVEVLYFNGIPGYEVEFEEDADIKDYKPPSFGTPVLVITDLGIGEVPFSMDRSSPTDWVVFSKTLQDAGCPLRVLTPYPPARWPERLKGLFGIIHWDLSVTVSAVRRFRKLSKSGHE